MTRSGLTFIAATQEKANRAFDSRRTGRQYVVMAAGGKATLSSGAGDAPVAIALPWKALLARAGNVLCKGAKSRTGVCSSMMSEKLPIRTGGEARQFNRADIVR